MATYAKEIQPALIREEGGLVEFEIHYGLVDTVVPTAIAGVASLSVNANTPGTWEQSFKDAVIADAAARGFTLPMENLRWNVVEPADYKPAFQSIVWPKEITKTNIPTTYTNVYLGAFGGAQLLNAFGCKEYRMTVEVNKVGTGTQTAALVDVTNAANLIELADTAAAGDHFLDSGWTALPAWLASGDVILKPMAKSTNAADDPIYRQFALYLR